MPAAGPNMAASARFIDRAPTQSMAVAAIAVMANLRIVSLSSGCPLEQRLRAATFTLGL
jgi:hypothetical protein